MGILKECTLPLIISKFFCYCLLLSVLACYQETRSWKTDSLIILITALYMSAKVSGISEMFSE